jgi:transposase
MIGPGTGVRVYLACGFIDVRKGTEGLTALTQDVCARSGGAARCLRFEGVVASV